MNLTRFLLAVEPEPADETTIGLVGVDEMWPVLLSGVDLNELKPFDGADCMECPP